MIVASLRTFTSALLLLGATGLVQAQPAFNNVQTCSAAYGKCFDVCAVEYPNGREASAKCVDACFMARAECDRSGCFKIGATEICKFQQR